MAGDNKKNDLEFPLGLENLAADPLYFQRPWIKALADLPDFNPEDASRAKDFFSSRGHRISS